MSTEVETATEAGAGTAPAAAAPPTGSAPNSTPTSPATAAGSLFKKEKKKVVTEKTDEYLLARFQGDGVRYKAKLIGVDDVPEARGDKMSQDSMMKLKGMAVAARSQGKHKQRIWVNISMAGIKIIDEKSGVIEHEHIVNKISFIARDVTDNRAFGYVCGAEGQHQFFAIKTSNQAEPLVIDLKDLFQVIFNQRKKEAEALQKGENSSTVVVENGSDNLLGVDAEQKTAKPVEQLDLFGDMSTPPDIHSPTSTNNNNNDLFGADLFAAPTPADGSSDAVDGLFNNTTPASTVASTIAALGNLQLGPTVTTTSLWGAPTTAHSMFPSPMGLPPGPPQPAFPQPSAFGGLPIPPSVWGHQQQQQQQPWGQPTAVAPGWGQPVGVGVPMGTNPFQPSPFSPMMGGDQHLHHQPPRPPPRPPGKDPTAAPPKVENSAFTALDPLGEKEKKTGKDMFKDFQMARPPPAIPARKGEAAAPPAGTATTNGGGGGGGGGGAFDQYFSSKVGVPQEAADHDDFDIKRNLSSVINDAPAVAAPAPAPILQPGLLDDAFSPAPAAAPAAAPSQAFNQSIFDEAFGAPPATSMGPPAVQTTVSSDPFGDPFGNPFA